MKNLWLALLLWPFTTFAQEHEDRLAQLDVQSYLFQVTLNENSPTIEVRETITIKFLQRTDEFHLDLVKENDKGGMRITEVYEIVDGILQVLPYTHDGDRLGIQLHTPTRPGQERRFELAYQGQPRDGLIISKNRHGDPTWFGDNWPNRARHWLATVDHPSDKAKVTWWVSAPRDYRVVANGVENPERIITDDQVKYLFEESTPLPTKVMVLAAAKFAVVDMPPVRGIPVSMWVFPQDTAKGFVHYAPAREILGLFNDSIAPYAYQKLANVQSKTRYGGMENASNIFYYESSVDKPVNALLAHEIAHQWFGNMATEANWHHIWLSEGFATYFTNLYFEWTEGEEALQRRMKDERNKVIRYHENRQRPVIDTTVTNYNALLNPNSYEKGAWVLHMLRQEMGYSNFMKGIREYYAQYGGRNALTEDLQTIMEEVGDMELDQFFEQWLYRAGHPVLELEADRNRNDMTLEVKQKQDGEPFNFPLELRFEDGKGNVLERTVRVTERKQEFQLDIPKSYKKMIVDPRVRLLAEIEVD